MFRPIIGAHVSAAGGLYKCVVNATAIGAETIQIFGASPRQWTATPPMAKEVEKYRKHLQKSAIKSVYLHASYLVNVASPNRELWIKSVASLQAHLKIAEAMGANGLIFHVGSGKECPKPEAMAKVVEAMGSVLQVVPGQAQLILENSAGGGQKLGATPAEIGAILKELSSARVKACIDTAHIFEAGVIAEYSPANVRRLTDDLEKHIGLSNIVALHVNDSQTQFNSHHDRHENIGEGYISLSGFKNLAREKRLWGAAWLLEVPGFAGAGPDKRNVNILKSCFR